MMQEAELFEKYRESGDVALRNEIAEKYLYIAAVIAGKFAGRGVDYDDLYQVASLALVKGVERYDPAKGVKFSTFITPTITGEIKNYFRDHSRLIHLPRQVNELRAAVRKTADDLTVQLGHSPSAREIAEALGVSEEEVVSGAEAGGIVSLDRPASDEAGATFHELIAAADDGGLEQFENREIIRAALEGLSSGERALIRYRFGEELSQTETAKRLGVSQMYVSRLERKVLDKLKIKLGKDMAE